MSHSFCSARPNNLSHGLTIRSLNKSFPSMSVMLANIDGYLQSLARNKGKDYLFNIFYTWGHDPDEKRNCKTFDTIVYDVDGILEVDKERVIEIIAQVTNTNPKRCAIIWTGNGLHYIIQVKSFPSSMLAPLKPHYTESRRQITKSLCELGHPCQVDDIWDIARILRVPNTDNRKPMDNLEKSVSKRCYVINGICELQDFDLVDRFPAGEMDRVAVKQAEALKPNVPLIMKECKFLAKHLECRGAGISEPEWVVALGVTAWLEDNDEMSHAISDGYAGYDRDETERKAEARRAAEGPRSCESIRDSIFPDPCVGCAYLGKIKNPTCIRTAPETKKSNSSKKSPITPEKKPIPTKEDGSVDYEALKESGFSDVVETKKGIVVRRLINELKDYYRELHSFINIPATKRLYLYEDGIFVKTYRDEIRGFADTHYRPLVEKDKDRDEFYKAITATNIIKPEEMVPPPGLINLGNGTLDLHKWELLPHSPKYRFTRKVPYNWTGEAHAPVFREFVEKISGGDKLRASNLVEWIGYVCSGSTYHIQKVFMGIGVGNNGKSTYCNLIQELVGKGGHSSFPIARLKGNNELAYLEDKLVNISSEEPASSFKDSSILKQLSGNDSITGANKYENFNSFNNRAKIMITNNAIPFIDDLSEGMRRRLLVIPFNWDWKKEGNGIRDVGAKLSAELSAILTICLSAYKDLCARGDFQEENEQKSMTHEMITGGNPVWEFLHDRYEFTGSEIHLVSSCDLYDDFQKNYGNSYNLIGFGKEVSRILRNKFNFNAAKLYKQAGEVKRGFFGLKKMDLNKEKSSVTDTTILHGKF